jgi:hypothetical protein
MWHAILKLLLKKKKILKSPKVMRKRDVVRECNLFCVRNTQSAQCQHRNQQQDRGNNPKAQAITVHNLKVC